MENALVEENEAIPASKATSNALVEPTEALTSTATMLDQVAGKLSSLKHDDEDDVFAQGMWIYLFFVSLSLSSSAEKKMNEVIRRV